MVLAGMLPASVAFAQRSPSAQDHFTQGVAALSNGKPTLALEKFNEALKLDPEMAERG